MARRVGIELSPSRCALIDVEVSRHAPAAAATEVLAFRTFAWNADDPGDLALTLRAMRESNGLAPRAVVVCWGSDTSDSPASVAPVSAAGFEVGKIISPPVALAGLSRLFPAFADDHVAYVAVNRDATALAIVHRGVLALGREIPVTAHRAASPAAEGTPAGNDALDFARRLAPELRRSFLALKQQARVGVSRLVICGDYPNLRSLTAPLMHMLAVDVAVLDGTQGIAVRARGPLDAAVIRERAAQMRVAWAAATDPAHTADGERTIAPSANGPRDRYRLLLGGAALLVLVLAAAWLAARARSLDDDTAALRRQMVRVESRLQDMERVRAQAAQRVTSAAAGREAAASQAPPPTGTGPAGRPVSLPGPMRAPAAAPPVVRSILYSADRRLALVGRDVVRPGDRIDAGVIVAIEPRAVVIRGPSGELRRIEVTREGAPAATGGPKTE